MNGGRCAGCSVPTSRHGCHCGRVPPNLTFVQRVLNNPYKRRKCARKCTKCVVVAAGGDSLDCLCNIDNTLHTKIDHRLQCWERELELRNAIAERLMQRTGKSFCELLFNRPVTVDVRDKLMMQRLLAHAESRNPKARHQKAVIKEQSQDGCCVKEIKSTKPRTKKYFEISGLPAGVKCELIGENCCVRRSGWIVSRTVQKHLAARENDIKRVLPFFPDIEYLQVIGKKMTIHNRTENDESEDYNEECACFSEHPSSLGSSEELKENNSSDCNAGLRDKMNENVAEDSTSTLSSGCSDDDFDYYSELICNRAKCHALFYQC